MAILNVTYQGQSQNVAELAYDTGDDDIRRMAAEAMTLGPGTFRNFVVDRFNVENRETIYLRPKVPFGAEPTRLFIGPETAWTDEGLRLSNVARAWAKNLMEERPGVCVRDISLVLINSITEAGLEIAIQRRLA